MLKLERVPDANETIESKLEVFRTELCGLINRHSIENLSNTPDFMIADYLMSQLKSYNEVVNSRDKWYGVRLQPGEPSASIIPGESLGETTPDYNSIN
jgi:hypothetical protein